jgi:hypothetical protein
MKIKQPFRVLLLCLVAVILAEGTVYAQSEEVTLVGEINDTHQLVAEGAVYDIDDTPLGDDLALNYISMKVKVKGTVRAGDELQIITVKSFVVVEE